MSKLGFIGIAIGIGIMGMPMALRLREGGHELFIHTAASPSRLPRR